MQLRHAHITDLPAIVAIYNSTVAGRMVTADLTPVSVESRLAWFAEHSPGKHPLVVAEDDAKDIIGWLSYGPFYERPAYDATAEISIYLHEAQRGKGYGKKLLQYAMEHGRELGLKTLLGFIFSHNTPSLNLFAQSGFEAWGHLKNIAILDGKERSVTIVGRRLS